MEVLDIFNNKFKPKEKRINWRVSNSNVETIPQLFIDVDNDRYFVSSETLYLSIYFVSFKNTTQEVGDIVRNILINFQRQGDLIFVGEIRVKGWGVIDTGTNLLDTATVQILIKDVVVVDLHVKDDLERYNIDVNNSEFYADLSTKLAVKVVNSTSRNIVVITGYTFVFYKEISKENLISYVKEV